VAVGVTISSRPIQAKTRLLIAARSYRRLGNDHDYADQGNQRERVCPRAKSQHQSDQNAGWKLTDRKTRVVPSHCETVTVLLPPVSYHGDVHRLGAAASEIYRTPKKLEQQDAACSRGSKQATNYSKQVSDNPDRTMAIAVGSAD
jgi:hypothetical protein